MTDKIHITFTEQEIHNFINFVHFINAVEKESFDGIEAVNNGLTKPEWETLVRHLKKSDTLVHPNKDGSSTTLDLTIVRDKINEAIN